MARTVEELDREVDTLKAEVELLNQQRATWSTLVRQFAGDFTNDADWTAIHDKIEEERRRPDPDLAEPRGCGSGMPTSFVPEAPVPGMSATRSCPVLVLSRTGADQATVGSGAVWGGRNGTSTPRAGSSR
jgi:hypothetical protein